MDISDRSKRYIAFSGTANKGATTSFMIKCPGNMAVIAGPQFQENLTNDRLVFGGWAWSENGVQGDYIKIDVVDHLNVLGAGVDYVLKAFYETSTISVSPDSGSNAVNFVNGILMHPTNVTEISSTMPSRLYGGMWLRISYVSLGADLDPKLYVNINWEKQNT